MKTQFARTALAAALLCFTAGAAVTIATTAAAASDKKDKGPSVSPKVGIALLKAQKAMKSNDLDALQKAIDEADAVPDKTDFDVFEINQFKGALGIQKKDYPAAAAAYKAMINSPSFDSLTDDNKIVTLRNAAALGGMVKDWQQIISAYTQLEKLNAMNGKYYAALSQAYYLENDFPNAAKAAKKSVDLTDAKGETPDKTALQILLSAQVKNNDQSGAMETLEKLAVYYGDPGDWGQVIDNGLATKGMSELDALYLYRLRFAVGAKSAGDDYTVAAGIALQKGYAVEAEKILEKGIAAGALSHGRAAHQLSEARSGARMDERSLKTIAAAAARSKSGEQDIQLAEDYWGYGRYGDAVTAARAGLSKGGLKDRGEGEFILGISLLTEGKIDEARQIFAKLDGSDARAHAAHLWDLYAQRKQFLANPPAPAAQKPAQQAQQPAQ